MITEQDIFTFTFFREKLSAEKINEILSGNRFAQAREFYSLLKSESDRDLSFNEKKSLAAKIPIYQFNRNYELLPFYGYDMGNETKLAANSKKIDEDPSSCSFLSETKEFLCRIVSMPSQKLLYCFSINHEALKNYKLTLHPSKITFECNSNSEPVIIPADLAIEKISIEFV